MRAFLFLFLEFLVACSLCQLAKIFVVVFNPLYNMADKDKKSSAKQVTAPATPPGKKAKSKPKVKSTPQSDKPSIVSIFNPATKESVRVSIDSTAATSVASSVYATPLSPAKQSLSRDELFSMFSTFKTEV